MSASTTRVAVPKDGRFFRSSTPLSPRPKDERTGSLGLITDDAPVRRRGFAPQSRATSC